MGQTQEIHTSAAAGTLIPCQREGEAGRKLRLAVAMFRIGLIGFGGGSALIPVIEEEVVDVQGLVPAREYDEDVTAACVTPGALPVEIAAGVGRRSAGLSGMLFSAVLMALPGALLTVLILSALSGESSGSLYLIRLVSVGLGAFIAGLLLVYAVKTQRSAAAEGRKHAVVSLLIMTGVFLLSSGKALQAVVPALSGLGLPALSTIDVLLLAFFGIFFTGCRIRPLSTAVAGGITLLYVLTAGSDPLLHSAPLFAGVRVLMAVLSLVSLLRSIDSDRRKAQRSHRVRVDVRELLRESAAWLLLLGVLCLPALIALRGSLLLIGRGLLSSLLSFGGGDAYLSVADGLFVKNGVVQTTDFYSTLVPIANVLPGSILCKILSGVGYLAGLQATGSSAGGFAGAAACFGVSVVGSGLVFGAVSWLFRTFEDVTVFAQISCWIRPIISGLLLGVMLTMVRTNFSTGASLGVPSPVILGITAAITAVDLFLLLGRKTGSIAPMLLSAVSGALMVAAAL